MAYDGSKLDIFLDLFIAWRVKGSREMGEAFLGLGISVYTLPGIIRHFLKKVYQVCSFKKISEHWMLGLLGMQRPRYQRCSYIQVWDRTLMLHSSIS